jgi:hypothetical protein
MKLRTSRIGIWAAEALGVFVAALLAGLAFLAWRIQAGPIDLSWSTPVVEIIANMAANEDLVSDIENASIAAVEDKGGYRLELYGVSIGGKAAEASATLPHVRIDFYPSDLIAGKFGPRRLEIAGARLRIVRRMDRKLKLDFGSADGKRARAFQTLTGGAYFREAFERASLSDVSIAFVDERSDREWMGFGGKATIERRGKSYAANLESDFAIGARKASASFSAIYDAQSDVIEANMSLAEAPVGDLVAVFFNENADFFTSPLSGNATVILSGDGAVRSSKIDLSAGKGVAKFGGWRTGIDRFSAIASFDPALNKFFVENLAWDGEIGNGALAGEVTLSVDKSSNHVETVRFDLSGENVEIAQGELFESPWTIDTARFAGQYLVPEKKLNIDALALEFFSVALNGAGAYSSSDRNSPQITAAIKIDGELSPDVLMRFWPIGVASSAREFVDQRMPKAKLSAVRAEIDLSPGEIGEDGALPDEAISIAFRTDGATVYFAPEMTPITGISGNGVLRGNSFSFSLERGEAGRVQLIDGGVEIPILAPKGEPAYFRFKAAGDAGDILSILNEKPLAVLAETNFKPEQFNGPVVATAEIMRPNLREAPPESYRFKATADFRNLVVDEIIAEAPLVDGIGRLELLTDRMSIKGAGRFAGSPVDIEWRQKLRGGGDTTEILISGTANSATADAFRIPTRQFVRGDAPFTSRAVGDAASIRLFEFSADLKETALFSEAFGWTKPAGEPAKASVSVSYAEDGTHLNRLDVAGNDFEISGSADFSPQGALEKFDLPAFRLADKANLKLSGGRGDDGALLVDVEGSRLDASEMIRTLLENGVQSGAPKTAFAIEANIADVEMRGGASYADAALKFRRDAVRIEQLDFSAKGEDEKPLSIELKGMAGEDQILEARSEDVGAMLAAIFGVTSVKGGAGWLKLSIGPDVDGSLEAHDMRVVGAPLLAKIFAAGSLTGLADLMNGEGIELKNAMARFAIADGEIRILESRATGPSVGITAQGGFDLDGDRLIDVKGAVAPAYGVNSLLGKAPVIGDIFVNRKGEGLLALSYDVSGPTNEPRVTVNPLSAFTPGLFRRMFEGRAPEDDAEDEKAPGRESEPK